MVAEGMRSMLNIHKSLPRQRTPQTLQCMQCVLASFYGLAEDVDVQPVVVSELELRDVQRQIFVADLVEAAHNPALDEAPEALDCVCVNRADDVLPLAMVNRFMRETAFQSIIAVIGVSAKQANARRDGFANERLKGFALSVRDDASDDVSLAPDCADDSGLERVAGTASLSAFLIPMPVFVVAADESFINFNDTAKFRNVLNEGDADFVAHKPSSLIGAEAHITIDLERAHSLFADKHQVNNFVPVAKRLVCILKYCTSQMREAVAIRRALLALPMMARSKRVNLWIAAARANDAFGPAARNEVLDAIILSLKHRVELRCGQLMDSLRFRLLPAGHDGSPRLMEGILA
jgi:hypothetical protein